MYSSFVCSLFMTKSYMTTFRGGATSTAAPVKVGRTPAEFQPCPPSARPSAVCISASSSPVQFRFCQSIRARALPSLVHATAPSARPSVRHARGGRTDRRSRQRERGGRRRGDIAFTTSKWASLFARLVWSSVGSVHQGRPNRHYALWFRSKVSPSIPPTHVTSQPRCQTETVVTLS